MSNIQVPDLRTPFLNPNAGGGLYNPLVLSGIGPLKLLSGTWNSDPVNLTGFNNMPLPFKGGVILKNLGYYEETTFSTLNGLAPNRGGDIQQQVFVLFYEQRVYIGKVYGSSEGPVNSVVHAENGSILHLVNYEETDPVTPPNVILPKDQQPMFPIVKQVSVPHGNSLLAVGNYTTYNTLPNIPDENCNPQGSVSPDLQKQYDDANVATNGLSTNPNIVLQKFNNDLNTTLSNGPYPYTITTTQFQVDTNANNGGNLTNLPFESKHASVLKYSTTFWHVSVNSNTISGSLEYLQYTQRIEMQMTTIPGVKFIHVDANTLRRVNS